jgi:error-prone DNA polymerase
VDAHERIVAEYAMLGFAASGHPLALLRASFPPSVVRSDHLERHPHGMTVVVVGLVVARQRPETARGFTFVLLEDEAGMMNAIVRPDVHDRDRVALRGEPFLKIRGTLAREDGNLNIVAEAVEALTVRPATDAVTPPARSPLRFLKELRRHPPGSKNWG